MYCHALLSEAAAGSSSAAAVGRHPEGAAYLSLAQIFSDRAGTLCRDGFQYHGRLLLPATNAEDPEEPGNKPLVCFNPSCEELS